MVSPVVAPVGLLVAVCLIQFDIADPDLIATKVEELVVMGGLNNDGFSLVRHNLMSASQCVIENWPTPLVISQPGSQILTGTGLVDAPVRNPVRAAYCNFFNSNFCGRPSWDQMAFFTASEELQTTFPR